MAGPIERARDLLPQLQRPRTVSREQLAEGGWLVLWGLFKKVYIADMLVAYTRWGINGAGIETAVEIYVCALALAIRVYADFSGYTDMARGMAKLLGFELSINFDLPFFASNPAEFWRRWHMTLTRWFTDYLYLSARRALMKRGVSRRVAIGVGIALTMTLMGLWHGASWAYVVWGAIWGVALVLHRVAEPAIAAALARAPWASVSARWLGAAMTFHLFALTLPLILTHSVDQADRLLSTFLSFPDGDAAAAAAASAAAQLATVLYYAWPLVLMQLVQGLLGERNPLARLPLILRVAVYVGLVVLLATVDARTGDEFVYFQF